MDGYSDPEPITQQKRSNSWKRAVIYDPAKQTLFTKKEQKLQGQKLSTKIDVPRFGSRVDIYVDEAGSMAKGFVGTANLNRLGWFANVRRHLGGINHLYVMEYAEERHTPIAVAA